MEPSIRYYLLVTVINTFINQTQELDLWAHVPSAVNAPNQSLKMEVGVESSLNIEFIYNQSR